MRACGDGFLLGGLTASLPTTFTFWSLADSVGPRPSRLFENQAHERTWGQFAADGFREPVSGAIFRGSNPPCCGMPLGGISTGCIDLDVRGLYGFSTVFNPWSNCPAVEDWRMPRKPQLMIPLLGLCVGETVWVLTADEIVRGGATKVCADPFFGHPAQKSDVIILPHLPNVQPAREIYYWGHYPVADVEFDLGAPVAVGLRAWSPFIPGDASASNVPAIVFEVRLSNTSSGACKGSLTLNFPGPDCEEALGAAFARSEVKEDVNGLHVVSEGNIGYVLGLLGDQPTRMGQAIDPSSWQRIGHELPIPVRNPEFSQHAYLSGGTSISVEFDLEAEGQKTLRFLLAWYAPIWKGAERGREAILQKHYAGNAKTEWNGPSWAEQNYYTQKYADRYGNALDVAREVATNHVGLLKRVLAWQESIYSERGLPVWLRDSLVNNLALLTEDSLWVQARPPLDAWAVPAGAFGLIESPRGDPDLGCIPCDWYGNLPIVFFFPDLALSNIRSYKRYQRDDGAAPFWLGILGDLPDFITTSYEWQISLNGTCYVDMVDRVWQSSGDDRILHEFYDSVKKCNTMTMNLREGPGGVISMPEGNKGMEWFEHGEWAGMCAHLGGLHLAQLKIMRRMAERIGDQPYVDRCTAWLNDGSAAMESQLWTGKYYLNFYEKETGRRSDDVMAYQLDGEWASRFHGLGHVFQPERIDTTLSTIRSCNIALTPEVGAVNFARPDGRPLQSASGVASYGVYAMFPAEVLVLAMTYMYAGQQDVGLELARRHWETLVLRQGHGWDMPNIVRGDTGERVYGTDYYQSMMLWALPPALKGQDIHDACAPGSIVDRVLRAGRQQI